MYTCGIGEVKVDRAQGHFVLPEILAQFRSRLDAAVMDELLAIQAAAAMEQGLLSPAHLVVDTFPSEQGSQRVNDAATLYKAKKVLQVIAHLTDQCATQGTALKAQAQQLQQDLAKIMRRFGRQCRGQGKVFVSLVRQTETQLLETGQPLGLLARVAQEHVQSAGQLAEDQRERLDIKLKVALEVHHQIATQSRRLTHGQPLTQCKIVNAYDPTIAPICKGKSNCPTQFGRKPGIIAEPATGFIFAVQLPVGNPSDASFVLPLVEKVQVALARLTTRPTPVIHSVAGDLALNDSSLRTTLHGRGILTVGVPHTVDPLSPSPPPEEIRQMLNEAGLTHTHTPHQVQLACACGYRRPVVESIIARLLSRGAARLTYKGQRGASVQIGMALLAHNAATVRRIHQDRLSKRAQKFRHLLRLKRQKANEFKDSKN